MPWAIIAYANYIKLLWCDHLCFKSTFIRVNCYTATCVITHYMYLSQDHKEPWRERTYSSEMTSHHWYLRPFFPLLQDPDAFPNAATKWVCSLRTLLIPLLFLSIIYPGSWITLGCQMCLTSHPTLISPPVTVSSVPLLGTTCMFSS